MSKDRVVNELSLMTDVFVKLERLRVSLEGLRDALVVKPDLTYSSDLYEARRHCRRIDEELRSIASLMRGDARPPAPEPPTSEPEPPKGPPDLKLVS